MRTESSIERALRELHAPRFDPPSPSPAHEDAVLAAWTRRHADQAQGQTASRLFGLLAPHRMAVALAGTLGMLFAVVGACVLPTSYDIPLGLSLEIRAASGDRLPVQELSHYVHERSDATEVDVLMRELVRDGGPAQMQLSIRLWDQNLALGELEPELRERFPALANAEIIETPLEGEIETIWARRLAHRAFEISLRDADVEHARHALLIELQSRGHEDDQVVVIVRDRDDLGDGHREIEVQVERHVIGGHVPSIEEPAAFHWVRDFDNGGAPSGNAPVELEAPPAGHPVRIHLVGEHR
jgi:hypothetical protein